MYVKAKVSMEQKHTLMLACADGSAPCERARESGKPQAFRTFAEAYIAICCERARESGKSMPFQTCTAAKLELLP